MKSNIKMVLGAVSAALVMMVSVASANDRIDFRGYTGCDRALDGLHQAWELQNGINNPNETPDAHRKWSVARGYASACLDVVMASCGSANGFLRPPAQQSSIRLCQDLLNGGYDRAIALKVQTFDSVRLVPGIHKIEATINVGFFDSENASVHFVSDCATMPSPSMPTQPNVPAPINPSSPPVVPGPTENDPLSETDDNRCKSINGSGSLDEIHIINGWGSASDVVSCPSSTRDFADGSMSLGDLMRNIPAHRQGFLDETKLNCTFFSAQPFTVKIVPKGSTK